MDTTSNNARKEEKRAKKARRAEWLKKEEAEIKVLQKKGREWIEKRRRMLIQRLELTLEIEHDEKIEAKSMHSKESSLDKDDAQGVFDSQLPC